MVIRRGQALAGISGRKGDVDGNVSLGGKAGDQPTDCSGNYVTGVQEREAEFLV